MQKTLPKGWKMVRLGEVTEFIRNGLNIKQSENGRLPITRIETISNGDIDKNRVKYIEPTGEEYREYRILKGDILFSHINSVEHLAKTAIYLGEPEELIHGVNLLLIRPKNIYPQFFHYWLTKESTRNLFRAKARKAVNQASLNTKDIVSIPTPLPPLPTQHKIVEILEEANNLRKLRHQADEKMKDLIPSLFIKMFGDPVTNPKGWEVKKLGEVCKFIYGDSLPDKKRNRGNIDVYGSNGVVGKHNTAITESEAIIIGRKGSVGEVNFSAKPCFPIDTTYFIDKRYTKQNLVWLFWLLKFLKLEKLSLIVGVPGLNRNDAYNSLMILPPLPLQQEFAKLVEDIEAEKAKQAESRKKLNELFNSLMQGAFTGKLSAYCRH